MKILVVFPSFKMGGAELFSIALYENLFRENYTVYYTSLGRNRINLKSFTHLSFVKALLFSLKYRCEIHSWLYKGIILSVIFKILNINSKWYWLFRHTPIRPNAALRRDMIIVDILLSLSSPISLFNSQSSLAVNKKWIPRLSSVDCNVIYNWINIPVFWEKKVHRVTDRRTVGILGRYHPVKGQDVLLNYLKDAVDHDRFCYYFAGRDFPEMVDIPENVFFCGVLDRDDFFGNIDVLVLPSVSESFPNVVYEAFARDIPVVSFDVGDLHLHFPNIPFLERRLGFSDLDILIDFWFTEKGQDLLHHYSCCVKEKFSKKEILKIYKRVLCVE